jgi:hypothetical protein
LLKDFSNCQSDSIAGEDAFKNAQKQGLVALDIQKKILGVLELKKSSPGASLYNEEMIQRWT